MNDTKTIRLPSELHRRLKAKAALVGKSIIDYLSNILKQDDNLPDCPLCRKYGNIPNAETIKALEEDEELSEPISGEEALRRYDEEFRRK